MAETALPTEETGRQQGSARGLTLPLAWRNLWRNKRRTYLTAGAIAFATLLVAFAMSIQVGMYRDWIEMTTGYFGGHVEVTRSDYVDDGKLEQTIGAATELVRELRGLPDAAVLPRVQGFGLISAGERSFGGLVMGVDLEAEARTLALYETVTDGALPVASDEILLGNVMARNLGVGVGDEILILSTAKEGGVAAMALVVSGVFSTGQAEFDRSFLFTHLETVQNGFEFGDEVHSIVVHYGSRERIPVNADTLASLLPAGVVPRSWQERMPEVVQGIEMDRISGNVMFAVILILVTFSVVNTFLMIVYERTREFGMLLALGMRPWAIQRQVQIEAALIWLVGAIVGIVLALTVVVILVNVGIPIEGIEEAFAGLFLPSRLYPGFSLSAFLTAPLVLLVGTQVAALIASARIQWMKPVTALRSE